MVWELAAIWAVKFGFTRNDLIHDTGSGKQSCAAVNTDASRRTVALVIWPDPPPTLPGPS